MLQAALYTAVIKREMRSDNSKGQTLVELFGNQLEKPWNLKELSQSIPENDRIPMIIETSANLLNLDFDKNLTEKYHNLRNTAFAIFTIIEHGSQFLSIEDYEYLLERFEIQFLTLPHSYW